MENQNEKIENEVEDAELSEEELDEASGGIIFVGGKQTFRRANLNFSELNPQPLPPGPPPDLNKLKGLGNLGSH